MAREVLNLQYRWHDELSAGKYAFGERGMLAMDASVGKIQCNRRIESAVTHPGTALELSFRVILCHTYQLCLYDPADRVVITCEIGADGWIRFLNGDRRIEIGRYMTCCYGAPAVDPEFLPPNSTRESDETTFCFDRFDFAGQTFRFSNGCDPVQVSGAFRVPADGIAKIEVLTPVVEPGTMFGLCRYVLREEGEVVDIDEFNCPWVPVAAPPNGYSYDHISEIHFFAK